MIKYIMIIIIILIFVNILYSQSGSIDSTKQDLVNNVSDHTNKANEPWYKIEAYSNYVVFIAGVLLGLLDWALKLFLSSSLRPSEFNFL